MLGRVARLEKEAASRGRSRERKAERESLSAIGCT